MKRLLDKYLSKYRTSHVAIDIGTYTIKLLEIKVQKGRATIGAMGSIATPPLRDGRLDEAEVATALSQLVKNCAMNTRQVITAVPSTKGMVRQIRVPMMSDQELSKAVLNEAQQHIPRPIQDFTVRYVKLGPERGGDHQHLNVMLVAVPTSLIEQYYHIFLMADLQVTSMDLQPFGLWRLFAREKMEHPLALVDVGHSYSLLVVVEAGEIKFLRTIAEGGSSTTDVSSLDHLAREINRSLSFYQAQPGNNPVGNILLSGGGCKLKGIQQYLTDHLGIPVEDKIPEVWNFLIMDQLSLMPYDPSYAMVLGLLLGEVPHV